MSADEVATLSISEKKEEENDGGTLPVMGEGIFRLTGPYSATPDPSKAGCYSEAPGEEFNVRIGPRYSKNAKKAPSLHSFYKLKVADVFVSPAKEPKIARKITWGEQTEWPCHKPDTVAPEASSAVSAGDCPRTIVVNMMIPTYEPTVMSKTVNGPGYNMVIVFTMSAEGKAELEAQESPASKMMRNFFTELRKYHGRFKAIPVIANAKYMNYGMVARKLLSMGNGKPFMSGPTCHSIFIPKDRSYFEIDLDFHKYSYTARKAISTFLPSNPNMVLNWGLVIQGNGDDELPEQMLGSVQLNRIDCAKGRKIDFRILEAKS